MEATFSRSLADDLNGIKERVVQPSIDADREPERTSPWIAVRANKIVTSAMASSCVRLIVLRVSHPPYQTLTRPNDFHSVHPPDLHNFLLLLFHPPTGPQHELGMGLDVG